MNPLAGRGLLPVITPAATAAIVIVVVVSAAATAAAVIVVVVVSAAATTTAVVIVIVSAAATAAAVSTTAAATTAAAAAEAAAASAAFRPWTRFVYRKRTTLNFSSVKRIYCRLRFAIGFHLHESEPFRLSRIPIRNYFSGEYRAVLCKQLLQVFI